MRLPGLLLSIAALAFLSGPAWSAGAVKKKQKASRSALVPARPDSSSKPVTTSPGKGPKEILSLNDPFTDPFGEFLRTSRRHDDSLQLLLVKQSLQRLRYDSALGHHLAVPVPDSGAFRDSLLAQRSRIFSQVWPVAAPRRKKADMAAEDRLSEDSLSDSEAATFAWGMGTSHSRGFYRSGAWQPDGWQGVGFEERIWMYDTYARQTWPLSVRGTALNLAANVSQSTGSGFSTFDAALEAHVPDGILADLSLVLSGGRRKSFEWGAYQSYNVLASKGWHFETAGLDLEAGFSQERDAGGRRMNDNVWLSLGREIDLQGGKTLGLSLQGAFDRQDPQYEWITAAVLYVDDVSKAQPIHFRAGDFRDTLPGNTGDALGAFAQHAGIHQLATVTPRSYLSLSPSFQYGFPLPAGFEALVGARYAVDFYRESAWDWVPSPDSMDLSQADLVGLAFNRADGRYYAAALLEEEGELQEAYGTRPLQQQKAKRLDQKAGLNLGLSRSLPHGYTLALDASAEFGWSNLSRTSPIGSQPWQWGLTFNLSRSSTR